MKNLFIMTHNMAGGGCEHVISLLANHFASDGIKVTVLTEYAHDSFFRLDPRIRMVALSPVRKMSAGMIPSVYTKLRAIVKKERPDAVLAMPEKVNVWTVFFLIGTGVPVIVSERNDPRHHPENRLKRLLRRIVYPFASGFIFQTEQQKSYFSKLIQSRGVVLDNPLDVDSLCEPDTSLRDKTIVSVARLEPQKNLLMLIIAFSFFSKHFPDYRLIIYGEGSERERLESKIRELGLSDKISMPGAASDIPKRIRSEGMFVLPSDFEGMPNALIEAMAMGLPCISTDCPAGGPRALIINEENGLLVPVGNMMELQKAMERLAGSSELSGKLGKAAVCIRERLNITVVADHWRNYVDSVIQKS